MADPTGGAMDDYATQLLKATMLSDFRQDTAVSRQGVVNHQFACHLMDLEFARDATEMSIPESYAVQGLASAQLPRDAAGINLSHQTPKT